MLQKVAEYPLDYDNCVYQFEDETYTVNQSVIEIRNAQGNLNI